MSRSKVQIVTIGVTKYKFVTYFMGLGKILTKLIYCFIRKLFHKCVWFSEYNDVDIDVSWCVKSQSLQVFVSELEK